MYLLSHSPGTTSPLLRLIIPSPITLSLLASVAFAGPVETTKIGTTSTLGLYGFEATVAGYLSDHVPLTDGYYTNLCNYPPPVGSMGICMADFYGEYAKKFNSTTPLARSMETRTVKLTFTLRNMPTLLPLSYLLMGRTSQRPCSVLL